MTANTLLVDLLGYTGSRGGTETYAREICLRLPDVMPSWRFFALTNHVGGPPVRRFFPGEVVTTRPPLSGSPLAWAVAEMTLADRVARRVSASVLWCPANFGPLHPSIPSVVTLHDMSYRTVRGQGLQRLFRSLTANFMEASARAATAVITGSATAQAEIVTQLGFPLRHVTVIHHGTSSPQPPDDPWSALSGLLAATNRTVMLSTGNRLPHKNFEGLLRALALIAPERRPLTIITGGGVDDPLSPLVSELKLSDDVVLLGWVTSGELEALYDIATLYACPSLNEGFGLPVIEAMRRGNCVVANDIPVLREVGGTAALYADAENASAFADAILSLIEDRASLESRRNASLAWAERFTWENAAGATAQVLRQAAERACT